MKQGTRDTAIEPRRPFNSLSCPCLLVLPGLTVVAESASADARKIPSTRYPHSVLRLAAHGSEPAAVSSLTPTGDALLTSCLQTAT